jgi:hypothetical protein
MRRMIMLLGIAIALISGCLSGSGWAEAPRDGLSVSDNKKFILGSNSGTQNPLGYSPNLSDASSISPWMSSSETWKPAPAGSSAKADSTSDVLIEEGHLQAKEAAEKQLRRILQGGLILGGLGLLAGVGVFVWRHKARRSCPRSKPAVRTLVFPVTRAVSLEPPVPDAVPQPDSAVSQKMRSAA